MSDEQQIDALRDDIEQTRGDMSQTIDQLQERLAPERLQRDTGEIVKEVADRVVAEIQGKTGDLTSGLTLRAAAARIERGEDPPLTDVQRRMVEEKKPRKASQKRKPKLKKNSERSKLRSVFTSPAIPMVWSLASTVNLANHYSRMPKHHIWRHSESERTKRRPRRKERLR